MTVELSARGAGTGRHANELRNYARSVLKDWQNSQTANFAKQLQKASRATARDYRGRSLLELLQNAHDAHPGDRNDGRVHVLLDETDGKHGTLYVANSGTPFTWDRVMAICKYAMSEKKVGEGIGNKGVGFRSVLELTNAPEIFSSSSGLLDGYRFRFAAYPDLIDLLEDADLAARAHEDLPDFQIPYPISELPVTCATLAAAGHVTVIRLPLKSRDACLTAVQLWQELAMAKVPVMLFLNRLESLTLEHRMPGDDAKVVRLSRSESRPVRIDQVDGNEVLPEISLAEIDLGAFGLFTMVRGVVPPDRLVQTVNRAVSTGDLDESWQEWTEPAIVEIALSHADAADGRLYTFLPLGGSAVSPLRGHLNAPFFTKVDRTSLDETHPLNEMLFTSAAETCLLMAVQLRRQPDQRSRRMAIDLISWEGDSAGLLLNAVPRVHGAPVEKVQLLPVLDDHSPCRSWDTPGRAIRWPRGDFRVLTADAARAAGVSVADTTVGAQRLDRLVRCLGLHLAPSANLLADHAERIAVRLPLPRGGEAPGPWDDLYVDLFRMFGQRDTAALQGRRLLLSDDSRLRHFNGATPLVGSTPHRHQAFFHPTAADATGLKGITVPRALKKRLFYTHEKLRWTNGQGEPHRAEARQFLVQHGLVHQFNVQTLLSHVRRELQTSPSDEVRRQALRFVFQVHRNVKGTSIPDDLGLHVPTTSGSLIAAKTAFFGKGWRTDCGDDLATVVAEGRDLCHDLNSIETRFVAEPETFTGRDNGTREDWQRFLSMIGVRDGLIMCHSEVNTWLYAPSSTDFAHWAQLPTDVANQWGPEIQRQPLWPRRPRSSYHGTHAFRIPGQGVATKFSEAGRCAFARLLLRGLARWSDQLFQCRWSSGTGSREHLMIFPTPAAVFLRDYSWLPVRDRTRNITFARPSNVWLMPEEAEGHLVPLPVPDPKLRDLLRNRTARSRLHELGMPIWGNQEDCVRALASLGRLVAEGEVGSHDRNAVEHANQRAWQQLADRSRSYGYTDAVLEPLRKSPLLIERGESLDTVVPAELTEENVIYVSEVHDNLIVRFIRDMTKPLLVVPKAAQQISFLLAKLGRSGVKQVSTTNPSVEIDGQDPEQTELGALLIEQIPWLPYALGVLAEHQQVKPVEQELMKLVATGRRIRLHGYESLVITLDNEACPLPERLAGVLPLPNEDSPLIAAPADLANDLTWDGVAKLSYAIATVLDRPDFTHRLKSAALQLKDAPCNVGNVPEQVLAAALDVELIQYRETVNRIDGSLAGIIERLYPLLVHVLGIELTDDLLTPRPVDVAALQALLANHEDALPLNATELIRAARAARGVDDLRERAGLGFAELNQTLAMLTPTYQQINRGDAHEDAVRRRVDHRRTELVDRLRLEFLAEFDACRPVDGWPDLRSLSWITAPDDWALTVEEASVELVDTYIDACLADRLTGLPEPPTGVSLPPRDRLNSENAMVVRSALPEIKALIRATGYIVPAAVDGDAASLLDQRGALDFRHLTKDDVVTWLVALGHWPAGMPATLQPAAHGVTTEGLRDQRMTEDQIRDTQLRRRRIVSVAGREVDVASGSYTGLISALRNTVAANPAIISSGLHFANLEAPATGRTRSGGRGGVFGGGRQDLSQEQRDALGFMGEWYAYEWLRRYFPATTEESWVSSNRRHVFPGSPGNDSLGYDFLVGSDSEPFMFEVKATRGDGGQIELGESEVRAAQRYAGSTRWSILAVLWIEDPERSRLLRLPNPFSAKGREVFRTEGGSIRFSYRLAN